PEPLPAGVLLSGRLSAREAARGDRPRRPGRQRDSRPRRLLPRGSSLRRGGNPLCSAQPGTPRRGTPALRPGGPLPPPRCARPPRFAKRASGTNVVVRRFSSKATGKNQPGKRGAGERKETKGRNWRVTRSSRGG